MRRFTHALLYCLLASVSLLAQDAQLAERARHEGRVVLYTSLAPTESAPLAGAFEKKYGVKVELWRAASSKVVQRTITEAQGRRYAVDVVETNGPEMEMLSREKLLGDRWVADRLNFFVVGYNTNKVKRAEIPATYEGFVDPRWKGRIGLEATDVEWMATLIKTWGDAKGMAYFGALSAMRPDVRDGHVLLASLVAAGEVPVALSVYSSEIEALKRRGAPIDYVPVQPVVARPQGIGVMKNAPHPNAARLFAGYVLSDEGQKL